MKYTTTTEKTFESKNIKFFYNNATDRKILDFLEENKQKKKNIKFGTLVKQLLESYIDGNIEVKDIGITKEEVSLMIQKAIEDFAAKETTVTSTDLKTVEDELSSDTLLNDAIKVESKVKEMDKESEKKKYGENKKPGKNLLKQLKNK